MRRTLTVFVITMVGTACESDYTPSTPSATTSVVLTSTTTTGTTTSAPTTSAGNRPPVVQVTGDDGCHPVRRGDSVTPCSVSLRAEAQDPDGDRLGYRWSGCASGMEVAAVCQIDHLGELTVTVEVTDGRGGRAEASKIVEGRNSAPATGLFFCFYRTSQNPAAPVCDRAECGPPLPTNGIGYCSDGTYSSRDADGDGKSCGPVTARGACSEILGIYECGGVATAFSFEFRTGTEPGDCVLGITVRDDWGATASTELSVPVERLQ